MTKVSANFSIKFCWCTDFAYICKHSQLVLILQFTFIWRTLIKLLVFVPSGIHPGSSQLSCWISVLTIYSLVLCLKNTDHLINHLLSLSHTRTHTQHATACLRFNIAHSFYHASCLVTCLFNLSILLLLFQIRQGVTGCSNKCTPLLRCYIICANTLTRCFLHLFRLCADSCIIQEERSIL